MEEFGSLWSYQESVEELKQKLLYTTLELESARAQANEEMKKNKENVKQLINLVKITCQERDEARNQLETLLNKLLLSSVTTNPQSEFLVKPNKANSSIAESNSLTEPYNYHSQSHTSSPVVDSFFEPPADVIAEPVQVGFVGFNSTANQDSVVTDSLVKGKTLPEKGKLLQAVLEAGPLLQTLMVAGPLPTWRNPPPVQPLHIPPVSIQGFSAENVDPSKSMIYGTNAGKSRPFVEMSCGLNFANGRSGSYNGRMVSAGTRMDCYIPNGKRQRFQ